jgi:hypothetical protein
VLWIELGADASTADMLWIRSQIMSKTVGGHLVADAIRKHDEDTLEQGGGRVTRRVCGAVNAPQR